MGTAITTMAVIKLAIKLAIALSTVIGIGYGVNSFNKSSFKKGGGRRNDSDFDSESSFRSR